MDDLSVSFVSGVLEGSVVNPSVTVNSGIVVGIEKSVLSGLNVVEASPVVTPTVLSEMSAEGVVGASVFISFSSGDVGEGASEVVGSSVFTVVKSRGPKVDDSSSKVVVLLGSMVTSSETGFEVEGCKVDTSRVSVFPV